MERPKVKSLLIGTAISLGGLSACEVVSSENIYSIAEDNQSGGDNENDTLPEWVFVTIGVGAIPALYGLHRANEALHKKREQKDRDRLAETAQLNDHSSL